jgi:phosphate transport system substrate-binding protein
VYGTKGLIGLLLCALVPALAACNRAEGQAAPVRITVAGSTAIVPLLKDAADRYTKQNSNVTITVAASGSLAGLQKVAAGEVTIGASDVSAVESVTPGLIDHRVAVVGYAVMANKGTFTDPITSLSKADVTGIFSGKYKNWLEVGGDDEPIVVVNRTKASGTRAAFAALAMGGENFKTDIEKESSKEVLDVLMHTSGAVSYLALSYRDPALKVFAYDHVEPNDENIKTGAYPLWSYEHLYTRGAPSPAVVDFLSFLTSGRYSREVLPGLGFIPLNDMRIVRDTI